MVYTLVNNGDVPDEDYFNLSLMNQTVIVCTSGTRPGSPVDGMTVFETDTGQLKVYRSGLAAWRRTGAFDTETAGHGGNNETTTISGITSTTPAAGSPACGVSFVAPPSGGVYVTVSGRINQSSNSFETLLGYQLRTGGSIGSGTITVATSSFRAIATGRAVVASGSSMASSSRRHRVNPGDLTPGSTYNVQTMHWVTGGTGSVDYREVIVEPVL